jgi:hypothetical protein
VRVGDYKLPVCKYGSSVTAKSMQFSVKSRPSRNLRFENTFELLNDLQCVAPPDLGSEVTPEDDVSLVERVLGD